MITNCQNHKPDCRHYRHKTRSVKPSPRRAIGQREGLDGKQRALPCTVTGPSAPPCTADGMARTKSGGGTAGTRRNILFRKLLIINTFTKDHLLPCKRLPFAGRKVTFQRVKGRLLESRCPQDGPRRAKRKCGRTGVSALHILTAYTQGTIYQPFIMTVLQALCFHFVARAISPAEPSFGVKRSLHVP